MLVSLWLVSIERCSGPFLYWMKEEIELTDYWTKKLMLIHLILHPSDKGSNSRLYVEIKEGCVLTVNKMRFIKYTPKSSENMKTAWNSATGDKTRTYIRLVKIGKLYAKNQNGQ